MIQALVYTRHIQSHCIGVLVAGFMIVDAHALMWSTILQLLIKDHVCLVILCQFPLPLIGFFLDMSAHL